MEIKLLPGMWMLEVWMENDHLLVWKDSLTINSNLKQLQTTTETEISTLILDTTHTIFCHFNEIQFIPHSLMSQSQLNTSYDVGTTLSFTCQSRYESLLDQSSFTICSRNEIWSHGRINTIICQLDKLE
jgi:hypothetical protein